MAVSTRLWSARRLLLTRSSQFASTFANASQVVSFVIPWLVLSRTGSALDAGGVAFARDRLGGRDPVRWWWRWSPTSSRSG